MSQGNPIAGLFSTTDRPYKIKRSEELKIAAGHVRRRRPLAPRAKRQLEEQARRLRHSTDRNFALVKKLYFIASSAAFYA